MPLASSSRALPSRSACSRALLTETRSSRTIPTARTPPRRWSKGAVGDGAVRGCRRWPHRLGRGDPDGRARRRLRILRDMRDVRALSLRDLAAAMMVLSDNTATNRVIERLGVERVAARMAEWGIVNTALKRKMYDFEAAKRGLENVATASDLVALLARLVAGECRDRATSDAVLAIMARLRGRPEATPFPRAEHEGAEQERDARCVAQRRRGVRRPIADRDGGRVHERGEGRARGRAPARDDRARRCAGRGHERAAAAVRRLTASPLAH